MSLLNSVFYLLLSIALLSQFTNADLIADICSTTRNTAFCDENLRTGPHASKADLKGLAQISIDISKNSAEYGLTLSKSLLQQAKDKNLKNIYEMCVENYRDAVIGCDGCTVALKKGDYFNFNSKASSLMNAPGTCGDGLNEGQLAAQGKKLQELCEIILNISVKLKGSSI